MTTTQGTRDVPEVGTKFDPALLREQTRSRLAQGLVSLLAAVSIGLLVCTAAGWIGIETTKDLAVALLSPLVAVTGVALGFYFDGNRGSQ